MHACTHTKVKTAHTPLIALRKGKRGRKMDVSINFCCLLRKRRNKNGWYSCHINAELTDEARAVPSSIQGSLSYDPGQSSLTPTPGNSLTHHTGILLTFLCFILKGMTDSCFKKIISQLNLGFQMNNLDILSPSYWTQCYSVLDKLLINTS